MTRDEIFAAINQERVAQDNMWGPDNDFMHDEKAWLKILREQMSKAEFRWEGQEQFKARLVKIAAVAVAALEVL